MPLNSQQRDKKGQVGRDHSRGCSSVTHRNVGTIRPKVDAEGWTGHGSLGMRMEVGYGARKGETWRVNS